MDDSELNEIKQKKEAEYKNQMDQAEQQMKLEEELKKNIRLLLEENAYDRLMNVKIVNYRLFVLASQYVLQSSQKLGGRKITEKELIDLLKYLKGDSGRNTKIKRI
ncbi:hypothetical protein KO465_03660 [Candidatus Micrarchaeota archaeon]|nr:hypothetical protein [Candidatus Micrarchaeota archaeon]